MAPVAEARPPPRSSVAKAARRPVVWSAGRWVRVFPATILYFDPGVAAVEIADGLEQDRHLLGAVKVDPPPLGDLHAAALADRRVALAVAVVDGEG